MVSNASKISSQQISAVLGHAFSEAEFAECLQQIKIVKPKVGKFWQTMGAEAGIYMVVAGKVRLIDSADELIKNLTVGESFGAATFFPDENFQAYAARASRNLELCYLTPELLLTLVRKHPQIQEHLYQQAQNHDALLTKRNYPGDTLGERKITIQKPEVKSAKVLPSNKQRLDQTVKKVNKAYFPNPSLKISHFWQKISRRYPFYAQQSASDCGAACLVMIGRYWGKNFSISRLRDIANVDRNGASLRGIANAAESLGFTTRPVKATLNRLANQSLPAIAHWEGKHYIVVYQITKNKVIVCDPAIGQRNLSYGEFEAGWTNYTVLLQPNALLQEAPETSTPFWQFFELVKPHGLVLFEIFLASLFIQIFGLVTPLFTQLILDRVVTQQATTTLTAVGLGLLIFGWFQVAMTGLRQYLLDHTANRVDLALIVGFINHTLRLPLGFFESRYVGDIIARVQENHKIQRFFTGEALSIVLDLLTVFVYVGLMFWYNWKLALLVLVIVPPFVILALVATPFLKRISREIFNAHAEETGYLIQTLTGIRTVKSMAVEQYVQWNWEDFFDKSIKKNFSGQVISNRLQIFSSAIENTTRTALLWFGAWLVMSNELTIGQLVAFNMLLGNVINPFKRLVVLWNEIQI
jgi:predicted double-glycine peptidase